MAAAHGLLIGGGEVRAVDSGADGTALFCELEGQHKVGVTSRLRLRYQTLNDGLLIRLDPFGDGRWKTIDPTKPVRFGVPWSDRLVNIELGPIRRMAAAFRVIPVRPPPRWPPGAAPDPALAPFLGPWQWAGEREYPAEWLTLDPDGGLRLVDHYGVCWRGEPPIPCAGGFFSAGLHRLRLEDGGRRMVRDDGVWWERAEPAPGS